MSACVTQPDKTFAEGPLGRIRAAFGTTGIGDEILGHGPNVLCFLLPDARGHEQTRGAIPHFLAALDEARAIAAAVFSRSSVLTAVISYTGSKRRGSRERQVIPKLRALGFSPMSISQHEAVAQHDREYIECFGEDLYVYWHCADFRNDAGQVATLLWSMLAPWPVPRSRWADIYIADLERKLLLAASSDHVHVFAADPADVAPLAQQFPQWLCKENSRR